MTATNGPGSGAPLLEVRGVSKYFGNVVALKDVAVGVGAGEVTCVLGDNGAGKSTFIKILSGVHRHDEGELLVEGEPTSFGIAARGEGARDRDGLPGPRDRAAHVDLAQLLPRLGADEGARARCKHIDVEFAQRTMHEELRKMGIDVRDPDQPVGTLSGGERQAVAIARAVYFGAKVLILDEPTSALGVKQSGVVLRYVAQARDRGLGVIFITHNPHHAYPVGDRFVILNRGRLMGDWRKSEITRDELVKQMSGGAELDALEHELSRELDTGGLMGAATETVGAPAAPRGAPARIGVGVIGFGWLGQAHSRSLLRIPTLFAERGFDAELVVCGDTLPERREQAVGSFGFARAAADWRAVVDDPDGRRGLHRRAEHAPPRARRGGGRRGQARVLREAGRRHARADRARREGRARGGRDQRRGLQLPLGAARAVRAAADRRRARWARSRTTAAGSSRCTAATRSASCRGASSSTRPATGSRPTS